jgi:hypothetical protein
MAKYRVWFGDEPDYKNVSSLAEAIKFIRKNRNFDESNSGIEELQDGEWDEWLDDDDQTIHEHLYMYGGKSKYLKSAPKVEEAEEEILLDDDDDDDLDEDEDEEIEDEELEVEEEDLDERLMDVIGGNTRGGGDEDEEFVEDEEIEAEEDEDLEIEAVDDLDDLDLDEDIEDEI